MSVPGSGASRCQYGSTMGNGDLQSLGVSPLDRLRAAVDTGDAAMVDAAIDSLAERFSSLQHFSVEWITATLSWIGRVHGEAAVEAALRAAGDGFIADRRADSDDWWALPAPVRARVVSRAMLANGATVTVHEDEDKIVLAFRCGTGGRLIDEGRYETRPGSGDGYLLLSEPGPMTFGRATMGVYCAHCSIHNELQPMERSGLPTTVEYPPQNPGEACVHHVYRTPDTIPTDVFVRVGRSTPDR